MWQLALAVTDSNSAVCRVPRAMIAVPPLGLDSRTPAVLADKFTAGLASVGVFVAHVALISAAESRSKSPAPQSKRESLMQIQPVLIPTGGGLLRG